MEEAVKALSWAHKLGCVEDPTGHILVKQVLEGANLTVEPLNKYRKDRYDCVLGCNNHYTKLAKSVIIRSSTDQLYL